MKESGDLLVGLACTADNHCAVRASSAPVLLAVLQGLHSSLQGCGWEDLGNLDRDLVVSLDIACSACLDRLVDAGESSVLGGKPSEDYTALHTLLYLYRPSGSHLFPGLVAFLEVSFPHEKSEKSLGEDEVAANPDPLDLVA